MDCKGVVPRKGAFTVHQEETEGLLHFVFESIPGADFEKCTKEMMTKWCEHLDKIDLTPVDYNSCDAWIKEMMEIIEKITIEATGKDMSSCHTELLEQALRHTVRIIWMRDFEWENLIRFISDPNGETNVAELYHTKNLKSALAFHLLNKTICFLQAWTEIIKPPEDPAKRRRSQKKDEDMVHLLVFFLSQHAKELPTTSQ